VNRAGTGWITGWSRAGLERGTGLRVRVGLGWVGCSDGSVDQLGEKLIWCSLDPLDFSPNLTKRKAY
jgi:hypothetical protein